MKLAVLFLQTILGILLSPLISGFIRCFKNSLRMRRGAPLLQPYYNLGKYLKKEEVVSEQASFIFRITPYVVLSAMITALFLVPVFHSPVSAPGMGDALVLFFILALSRFFLALAGLDAGSAFGGMGSSREMFISSLVEPVAITALCVIAWQRGSLNIQQMQLQALTPTPSWEIDFAIGHLVWGLTPFSSIIAAAGLFMVILAETSRVPVDNQETHLELTMVHEAMLLEYSGRSLAMLELAAHIKQFILFALLACILWPLQIIPGQGPAHAIIAVGLFVFKIILISGLVGAIEIALAKMRLFRVVDFLAFGFMLSLLAIVVQVIGY